MFAAHTDNLTLPDGDDPNIRGEQNMTKKEVKRILDKSSKVHKVNVLMKQFIEMQTYAAYDKIPFDNRSMMALQLSFLPIAVDLPDDLFQERIVNAKKQLESLEKMLVDAKLGRWG